MQEDKIIGYQVEPETYRKLLAVTTRLYSSSDKPLTGDQIRDIANTMHAIMFGDFYPMLDDDPLTPTQEKGAKNMKEWSIQWAECPTNYNPLRTAIVEAETARDAYELLSQRIDRAGIGRWATNPHDIEQAVKEYKPKQVKGTVKVF